MKVPDIRLFFGVVFTLGVLIWNTLLLVGGYLLGDNWERIMEWLRVYNTVVIVLLLSGLAAFIWFRYLYRRPS